MSEQSRSLPVYLRAADAAGVALRARRTAARSRRVVVEPLGEPTVPSVSAAAVSESGELSFVLTGVSPWRRTIDGVVLRSGSEQHQPPTVLTESVAGVFRINAALPPDLDPGVWDVVCVDADGEPLDLPTPDLTGLVRAPDA